MATPEPQPRALGWHALSLGEGRGRGAKRCSLPQFPGAIARSRQMCVYRALRRGSERATLYRPTAPFAGAQSVPPFIGLPRPSPGLRACHPLSAYRALRRGSERATLYRPTAPFAGAQSVPPFIGLPRPSPGLRACHPLSAYRALRRGSERATLYRPATPFAGAQSVPPFIGLPRPSPGLRACHPLSAYHALRRGSERATVPHGVPNTGRPNGGRFSAHGVCSLHYCIPPNGASTLGATSIIVAWRIPGGKSTFAVTSCQVRRSREHTAPYLSSE